MDADNAPLNTEKTDEDFVLTLNFINFYIYDFTDNWLFISQDFNVDADTRAIPGFKY